MHGKKEGKKEKRWEWIKKIMQRKRGRKRREEKNVENVVVEEMESKKTLYKE